MKQYAFCLALTLFVTYAQATTRIAVLDFELKDLTLAPNIPAEIERTAGIKTQLEGELGHADYEIISIPLKDQARANAGFGYLFDHHDVAADLAKKVKADYVLVGRLHKPSFLFAYNYTIETKGGDKTLTHKAIESLTVKIDQDLDKRYSPPPPRKKD
jgi:hypothetical protein